MANAVMGLQSDSTNSVNQLSVADSLSKSVVYLPQSKFMYSTDRRYMIDGSLPMVNTKIKPVPAAIAGGLYFGTLIVLHQSQKNAWWSGTRRSFHFQEDWTSALQVDKAGHAFGTFLMSYFITEGLTLSGFGWDAANIWGSALGLGYQTYVEVEDGFAKDWGFSPSDFYFDAMGSIFFLAQHYVPVLQYVTPKWQFVPSEWTGKGVIGRPRTFLDDYNSSTFWWSVDVYNLLPKNQQKYWLPYLNVAIGYGGDDIGVIADPNGPPDQLSVRRYIVGLDINLTRLIPELGGGTDWWIKQTFNYIKLPMPAVEFSKGNAKFYLLYPFRINLGAFHL
ncbi:MAG: DUF2279 domain-containing protein [Ignavibacteria bacterium]